ncbi:transporter [Pacificimonas flava]|uniref:Transporter n=2 Tax=Pacificimonas TaxID=1960290 RepID=A0A219B0U6_9SPHN|nr:MULTISPECIES: TolC family protein [Pacificimonas]MBZ6379581.1 TolC family protein [Pacificimonas aurantium]OWV31945.1 transporter [Pacificimonas flava]
MRKLAFVLAMPLLATACAVGPEYHAPATATADWSEPFVTTAAKIDPTADLPDDWWRLYRDPVLDDLVARALAANADLRVAAANLQRAEAVLSEARAGRLPSTTVTGGVSYGDVTQIGGGEQGGVTSLGGTQWSANAGFGVDWEADIFGRIGRTVEAARADAQAVEAARDSVRVLVAAETTRAYFNACSYAFALDLARRSYAASADSLELIETLERAGSVGMLDVERAGAAAAAARADIPSLAGERQAALFELAALLGTTPDDVPEAARQCEIPPTPIADLPVGDGAALLRRRPDLREAERRLAADTARIGVAMSDLYPTVSFTGLGSFFRSDAVRGGDSFSFSLGPLVSWNFPNASVARARVRQAEARQEASLAVFDGTILTALKEVEQALARVAAAQKRLESLEEAATRAERAYEFAELRYRAGSAAYLDVLVAQADLLDTRALYANQLRTLASTRVDLFKALGGGWHVE